MVERNSKRGRKPSINSMELITLHTTKKVELIINGTDKVIIPKSKNLMLVRG